MAFTKGSTWDLFISYARNDNVPAMGRWVTAFTTLLREALPRKLGDAKDLQIFFDQRDIHGPGELDPKIEAAVKSSVLFVAVLSRSYVMSDWCLKELKYFLDNDANPNDRLYLIDLDNVLADKEFSPSLESRFAEKPDVETTIQRIRGVIRHPFYERNELQNLRLLIHDPTNPDNHRKYSEEIAKVTDNLGSILLAKKSGPTSSGVKPPRALTLDESTQGYLTSGGAGAAASILSAIGASDAPLRVPEQDKDAFLAGMEGFIKTELARSRDQHFIELSMKLASATEANVAAPLYRNLKMALVSYGQEQRLSEVSDLHALQRSAIDHNRLVMLASPGSGKTTLLHHLTLKCIGDHRSEKSDFLPLFVPLAMYIRERGSSSYPSVRDWIRKFIATIVPEDNFIHREFDKLVQAGRFIFILDGLDQLPNRRSQLARLEDLRRMEVKVQRLALLALVARFLGEGATSILEVQQQAAFERTGPEIDRRERWIEAFGRETRCPIIVSCRENDFLGVPRWQRIDVLPMSKEQIDQFVELYAREAKDIVDQQWKTDPATRSLVSNPFYLRMLTRAVEQGRLREDQNLRQILGQRGFLLSHLLWTGVLREVSGPERKPIDNDDPEAASIMEGLGDLAFFMMSENFIRGLTMEIVSKRLGDKAERIIKVAHDAGIIDVSEAEIPSERAIDFNHQLFLEVLLADYFLRRLNKAGEFQELLVLLGKRGDRWAETIKLLSEMLVPAQHATLMNHCIEALDNRETSDIAVRVLAEIGRPATRKLIEVLRKGSEIAKRGAAQVLGHLQVQEAKDVLVRMKADPAWSVRRAAVEALCKLSRADALVEFKDDPSAAVRRSVYKSQIALDQDPVTLACGGLAKTDPEVAQFARAVREMFDYLASRGSADQIAALVRMMCRSENEVVHITGFMLAGAAPEQVRYLLKEELLKASICEKNDSAAALALQAVRSLLSHADFDRITSISEALARQTDLTGLQEMQRKVRTRTLHFEVQSQGNLDAYVMGMTSVPLPEIQNVTHQIAARNDQAALAALTYLLRHRTTARAAAAAMSSMGQLGVARLLHCLDDDVPEIRKSVAQLLRHCDLPHRYARIARHNLKDEKTFVLPSSDDPQLKGMVAGSVFFPLAAFAFSPLYAILSWLFGSGASYTYWTQYVLLERRAARTLGVPQDKDPYLIQNVERVAFRLSQRPEEKEYWLARARVESRAGETDDAIHSLETALSIDQNYVDAAYELALLLRKTGEFERALGFAKSMSDCEPEWMPKMHLLSNMIELDLKSARKEELTNDERWVAIETLCQLGDWADLLQRLKLLRYAESQLPHRFFSRLCDAYAGLGDPRAALGAALINNAKCDCQENVSLARLETWRSQITISILEKEVIARFAVWTDLAFYQQAFDELSAANVLPPNGDDLDQPHIAVLESIPPDLRPGVKACLEALHKDSIYVSQVSKALKLNY